MRRLVPEPVFGDLLSSCRGIQVAERMGCGVATVLAEGPGPGAWPDGPRRTNVDGITVLGISRRTWLAFGEGGAGMARALGARLAGIAHVADQSGAYGVLELTGLNADAVLAKGLNVDLHSSAFPADGVSVTSVAHIDVVLCRRDEGGGYRLVTPRSSAGSFMHWLSASAAEFA
jgi:sarcosine oxidase subunit gamma